MYNYIKVFDTAKLGAEKDGIMAKIAILGLGKVGGAVYGMLSRVPSRLYRAAGETVEVRYVLNRSSVADRVPPDIIAADIDTIAADSEVSLVVETIGGTVPAYNYVCRCLEAKKHVVTANKELVATYGAALFELAQKNGVNFLFEGAVCGAVPIISALGGCARKVEGVQGILNGTTNYILTEMSRNGATFEQALVGAQKNGYAEADPSDDVGGVDSLRKLCILASLCFGGAVTPSSVYCEGITKLTPYELKFAARQGCAVKLLGVAAGGRDGAHAFVSPAYVGQNSALYSANGADNAVSVFAEDAGTLTFAGAGAGGGATASAVLSDIAAALTKDNINRYLSWPAAPVGLCEQEHDWAVVSDFLIGGLPADAVDSLDGKLLCVFGGARLSQLLGVLDKARADNAGRYVGVPIFLSR